MCDEEDVNEPSLQSEQISRTFGKAVKQRRIALAMSQEELAELSGLHRTYISDVERAKRNITLKSAARIASALSVTVNTLLETDKRRIVIASQGPKERIS